MKITRAQGYFVSANVSWKKLWRKGSCAAPYLHTAPRGFRPQLLLLQLNVTLAEPEPIFFLWDLNLNCTLNFQSVMWVFILSVGLIAGEGNSNAVGLKLTHHWLDLMQIRKEGLCVCWFITLNYSIHFFLSLLSTISAGGRAARDSSENSEFKGRCPAASQAAKASGRELESALGISLSRACSRGVNDHHWKCLWSDNRRPRKDEAGLIWPGELPQCRNPAVGTM